MSVVRLAVQLLACRVQGRAVGHDHVVAAVGRGVPDGLVLAHQEGCDSRGETAEGGRGDGLGGSLDGAKDWVRLGGGNVVPYSRVGQSGLLGEVSS